LTVGQGSRSENLLGERNFLAIKPKEIEGGWGGGRRFIRKKCIIKPDAERTNISSKKAGAEGTRQLEWTNQLGGRGRKIVLQGGRLRRQTEDWGHMKSKGGNIFFKGRITRRGLFWTGRGSPKAWGKREGEGGGSKNGNWNEEEKHSKARLGDIFHNLVRRRAIRKVLKNSKGREIWGRGRSRQSRPERGQTASTTESGEDIYNAKITIT